MLSELLVSSHASDVARSVSSPHADISNTAGRPVYSGIFKGLLYICCIHVYICMYMPQYCVGTSKSLTARLLSPFRFVSWRLWCGLTQSLASDVIIKKLRGENDPAMQNYVGTRNFCRMLSVPYNYDYQYGHAPDIRIDILARKLQLLIQSQIRVPCLRSTHLHILCIAFLQPEATYGNL